MYVMLRQETRRFFVALSVNMELRRLTYQFLKNVMM
jgi:hypothetical protein